MNSTSLISPWLQKFVGNYGYGVMVTYLVGLFRMRDYDFGTAATQALLWPITWFKWTKEILHS